VCRDSEKKVGRRESGGFGMGLWGGEEGWGCGQRREETCQIRREVGGSRVGGWGGV